MNNKTKAGIAAVASVAVLGAGSTFALWGKSATVTGGTIKNGALVIAATSVGVWDTSADRSDATETVPGTTLKGHNITDTVANGTWHGVPGDTVAFVYNIDGALDGDNMTATLNVATPNGSTLGNGNGWNFQYALFNPAGAQVGNNADTFNDIRFSSANNSHNVDALPTMPATLAATGREYKLVVTGTFDPATANTDEALDTVDLSNLNVSLNQDRTTDGKGGFTAVTGPVG